MFYRQVHLHEVTTVSNSVWYDGYRAFLHGKTPDENPFANQTPGYYSWHNGWHCARMDFIEHKAKSTNPARPENSGEQT